MKKNIFFGVLIFIVTIQLIPQQLIAQDEKERVVLFGATKDGILGDGVQKSIELLEKEFNDIEAYGMIKTDVIKYIGDNCSTQQLDLLISDLGNLGSALQDDVLIFYFIGHGYRDFHKETPNLLFMNTKNGSLFEKDRLQNSRNLEDVHNNFKNLKNHPRLLITIGEACNADIAQRNKGKKSERYMNEDSLYREILGQDIKPKRYEELFNKTAGDIILYSSLPGSVSYFSDTEGGIFTQAFIKGLQQTVTYTTLADWTSIYHITQKYALRISRAADLDVQIPRGSFSVRLQIDKPMQGSGLNESNVNFIDKFLGGTKFKRTKKEWKRIVKGEVPSLKFRQFLQNGGEDFLLFAPMNYYWLKGYLDEIHADKKGAYLNYSIAYQLFKEQNYTKYDAILIDNINEKVERGRYKNSSIAQEIRGSDSMYKWLKQKQLEQLQYFLSLKEEQTSEDNGLIETAAIIYGSIDSLKQHISLAKLQKEQLIRLLKNSNNTILLQKIEVIGYRIKKWEYQVEEQKKQLTEIGDKIDERKQKISDIDRIIVENGLYGKNTNYDINEYILKKR